MYIIESERNLFSNQEEIVFEKDVDLLEIQQKLIKNNQQIFNLLNNKNLSKEELEEKILKINRKDKNYLESMKEQIIE